MAISRGHLAQVTVKGKLNGQDYRNVLHFTTDVEILDGTRRDILLALAAAVIDCLVGTLLPSLPQTYSLEGATVKELHPMASDEYESVVPVNQQAGAAFGQSAPSFVASLVRLRTGKAGRTHRGRIFLPPPTEANLNVDDVSDAFLEALTQFAICMVGKFVGVGKSEPWQLCVLSKKGAGTPVNYALATDTDVTDIVPQRNVAVMRRRRVGHGR
jgi:hypothetical protein